LTVSPDDISKNNAARITKRDIQTFHDDYWKSIYFWVKRSKVKVTMSVSVFRQCKLRWVFPAVMSHRTSNASGIRFSLHHYLASACC